MKKTLLASILLAVCFHASASSLSAQIGAVAQAEQEGRATEQRIDDAAQAARDYQDRLDQQHRIAAQAAANKRAAARDAAIRAERAKRDAEIKADKQRDQNYEDKLRDLEVKRQELAVAREEARVKRENEYIDQELRAKSAESDVVKSQADAERARANGEKTLMEKEGEARVKKVSGWFN